MSNPDPISDDQQAIVRLAQHAGAIVQDDASIVFPDLLALQYFAVLVVEDPSSSRHVRGVAARGGREDIPSTTLITDATLTIGEGRSSHFACPQCERRISMRNAFPLSFQFKRCHGCNLVWTNIAYYENPKDIGPHVEKIPAGTTVTLGLVSSGEPVR